MEEPRVLTLGAAVVDYIATVNEFPQPDTKIRSTSCKMEMGGNCLNVSVCLARLGVRTQIVTKLGDDSLGRQILDCFKQEQRIDYHRIVYKQGATSPFSFVMIDAHNKTRTIVHNPLEYLIPGELQQQQQQHQQQTLELDDSIELVVLDGKHAEVALEVARAAHNRSPRGDASRRYCPVLLDGEIGCMSFAKYHELFQEVDYVKCEQHFPLRYTNRSDLLEAMDAMMRGDSSSNSSLSNNRVATKEYIITTLGSLGSILMKRNNHYNTNNTNNNNDNSDAEQPLESVSSFDELSQKISVLSGALAQQSTPPSSPITTRFSYISKHVTPTTTQYTITYCSSWPLAPSQLVDTTGAGDVFLGSIGYSILQNHSPEVSLRLASFVAAMKCCNTGISGIPTKQQVLDNHVLDK